MANLTLIIIWGFLVLLLSVISTISVYKKLVRNESKVLTEINKAEKEFLEDLAQTERSELEQTESGRKLLDMLRDNIEFKKNIVETNFVQKVKVVIFESHVPSVDGYLYSLSNSQDIEIVGTTTIEEELIPLIQKHKIDILLTEINVIKSLSDTRPYNILDAIPDLLQTYPALKIIAISMHREIGLISAALKAGVQGYILKDDQDAIKNLENIIQLVTKGGTYFSEVVYEKILNSVSKDNKEVLNSKDNKEILTSKEIEVLEFFTSHPNSTVTELAKKLSVSQNTVWAILKSATRKLGVSDQKTAIDKARELGILQINRK